MRNVEDVYPLSPLQRSLLAQALSAPDSDASLIQLAWTLEDEVDPERLRRAWQQVVDRHPMLRTAFVAEGFEEPMQVVLRKVEVPFSFHDWRRLQASERDRRLAEFLEEDRRIAVRPRKAPLLRVSLFRLGDASYRLVWTYHHLILDAWARNLVLQEVVEVDSALRAGRRPSMPAARPFRDYIAWLGEQDAAAVEVFWRQRLEGFTTPTSLPVLPGGSAAGGPRRVVHAELDEEGSAALVAAARRHRLTLSTLVHGAWALVLSRYTGLDDVSMGTTVNGRPPDLPGSGSIVGMFVNNLPLRVRVPDRGSAVDWLWEIQAEFTRMRAFEHTPAADLQRWSDIPGARRLFETLVVVQNPPRRELGRAMNRDGRLAVEKYRFHAETALPWTLIAVPGKRLSVRLHYDTDRSGEQAARRILAHLLTSIQELLQNRECPPAWVPMLAPEERRPAELPPGKEAAGSPGERRLPPVSAPHSQALGRASEEAAGAFFAGLSEVVGVGPGDVWLGASTEGVVAGLLAGLSAISAEAEVVVPEPGESLADAALRHGATAVVASTSRLIELAGSKLPDARVLAVGEPPGQGLVTVLEETGARVFHLPGATSAILCPLVGAPAGGEAPFTHRPLPGARVQVLDRLGRPVPPGVPGQVWAAGTVVVPVAEAAISEVGGTRHGPGPEWVATPWAARRLPEGELELLGAWDHERVAVPDFLLAEAALRRIDWVVAAALVAQVDRDGVRRPTGFLLPSRVGCDPGEALGALRGFPAGVAPAGAILLRTVPEDESGWIDRFALAEAGEGEGLVAGPAPPRNSLELRLLGLWEDLFDLRPLGVDSDFFALGGGSLLALRLVAQVRAITGRELPLSTLATHRTVAALAAWLQEEDGSRTWDPMVPLQPRGSAPPLFCVHPGGGDVICYAPLAEQLAPSYPFAALRARGREAGETPFRRIEEMAAAYLEAIRRQCPGGPYRLAGWSFGGLVAYEMARQLEAAGERVDLLAMFDAAAGVAAWGEVREMDHAEELASFVSVVRGGLSVSVEELRGVGDPERQWAYVVDRAVRERRLAEDFDRGLMERSFAMYRAHLEATRRYRPGPYEGRVTLLRARKGVYPSTIADPSLGWEGLARGGVEIVEVPGRHRDMVGEPHVRVLARRLRSLLGRLDGGSDVAGPTRTRVRGDLER